MKWERHMSRMGEKGNAYRVLVMQCEGKNRLEDIGIEGRITLRHILRKYNMKACIVRLS